MKTRNHFTNDTKFIFNKYFYYDNREKKFSFELGSTENVLYKSCLNDSE